MAGLAPVPFCGMILQDFGASVIRVDRPRMGLAADRLCRGKKSIVVDVKRKEGVALVKRMANAADVLIEPYRPGVMERFGLGPDVLLESNPRLVYARVTGFGQTGPFSTMAGHDINYVALSGTICSCLQSPVSRSLEQPRTQIVGRTNKLFAVCSLCGRWSRQDWMRCVKRERSPIWNVHAVSG